MAKPNMLLCFVTVLLCISLTSGSHTAGSQNVTNGDQKVVQVQLNTWCVAKPDAPEEQLNDFIEFCRTESKVVQCVETFFTPTGTCYLPNTIRDHASVCLNEYYKVLGPCHQFLGQITYTNSSHGQCIFT